jgi:hypothetical protein
MAAAAVGNEADETGHDSNNLCGSGARARVGIWGKNPLMCGPVQRGQGADWWATPTPQAHSTAAYRGELEQGGNTPRIGLVDSAHEEERI